MAFGTAFDGYLLLHAPFATAERLPVVARELARVGVERFEIVEAKPVPDDDPRLPRYFGRKARISLLDVKRAAIERAAERGWASVAVFEDDVVFRDDFAALWAEVEAEVREADWGVLTLHRAARGAAPLVKEPRGRTRLMPQIHNISAQFCAFRAPAYAPALLAMGRCEEVGFPSDFFYGIATKKHGVRLMATSRNLAGQRGGVASTVQIRSRPRGRNFYAVFRSCRTWAEFAVVAALYRLRGVAKRGRGATAPGTPAR